MTRKRRTREHVIEDLSFNHVERFVLQCGWSVQRQSHDYGIDLAIFTYDSHGEIENGYVAVQVKGTDKIRLSVSKTEVLFTVDRSDIEHWWREPLPVILIRYDAVGDVAYWLHIQEYFRDLTSLRLLQFGKTVAVRIPVTNMLSKEAVQEFAQRRDDALKLVGGEHHGEARRPTLQKQPRPVLGITGRRY